MFDFLGKKPTNDGNVEPRPRANAGSLLDVVVPFSPKRHQTAQSSATKNAHNSLLSQIDVLTRQHQENEVEKQATARAELRARKAAHQRDEQLARLEADRDASRRFEEKANNLAEEIERVRQSKYHEANSHLANRAAHANPPENGYRTRTQDRHHPRSHVEQDRFGHSAPYGSQTNRPIDSQPYDNRPNDRWTNDGRPNDIGDGTGSYNHEREQFERFQQWQRSAAAPNNPRPDARHPSHGYDNYPPAYDGDRSQNHGPDNPTGARYANDVDRGYVGYGNSHPPRSDNYQRDGWHHEQPRQSNPTHPTMAPMGSPAEKYAHPVPEQPQPAESGGLYGQNQSAEQSPSQPLPAAGLDLDKIFSSILGSWKLIGLFAIIGAVLAGVYAKSLPNKYQAWAELLIDPQGITLIDKQLSSTGYGGEAMIAYLESQLRIIESTSVLNVVIDKENLLDDYEFSGNASISSGLLNILNPVSQEAQSAYNRQVVIDNLQDKLTIARGSRTFIVSIGMMSEDGDKSARIANAIAQAYVNGESGARSKIARDASENLSDKLETLRNRVLQAERKVADYKAENGLITTDGKLISEVQLSRLNEQLATARIETVNAKTKMEQLRSIDLSDVISGALPASLNTGTLSQLRVRYATLKSTADRLSTKLGPKHPERIAASAELDSAQVQISRDIRRSIAGSQKDFERAKKRQKALNEQLNTVKATAAGTGNSLINLRELERELGAHKQVYENYLLRSRETSEQEGLKTTNARVITVATSPLQKASPNRKVIAGVGMIAGGLLGLMIALLRGMFAARRSKQTSNGPEDSEVQNSQSNGGVETQNNYAGDPGQHYGSGYRAPGPSPAYNPRRY